MATDLIIASPQSQSEMSDDQEGSESPSRSTREKCDFRSSKSARLGATINLVLSAMGGGGIFANIFGASQLGIVGFIFVTFWSMILTFVSIQFLCIAAHISTEYSCYLLSRHYLGGKKGETLTKLLICFGNWCYIVNIIQIFADFMQYLLPMISNSSSQFWTSREFVCILALLLIFPFIMVKSIKHLENLSGILLIFAFTVLVVMVINAFNAILTNEVAPTVQIFPSNYNALFRGLPPITWSWAMQFNVMPVYMSLNPFTRSKQMKSVAFWAVSILFVYYILFGTSAMLVWGNDRINDDFITNLDYNDSNYVFFYGRELATVAQFILCIITFASIPIFAFEGRRNLHYILMDIYCYCMCDTIANESDTMATEITPLIPGNNTLDLSDTNSEKYTETSTSIFFEGTILMVSAACTALLLQNLNWSLGIVGATYGCYIVYFIPATVYYLAVRNKLNLSFKFKCFKFMAFLIFSYGIMVSAMGLTEAFV